MKTSWALVADATFLFLFTCGVAFADGMSAAEWQKVERGSAVAPAAPVTPEVPRFQPAISVAPVARPDTVSAAPIAPTLEVPRGRDLAVEEEKLLELERQMLNKLGSAESRALETFDDE